MIQDVDEREQRCKVKEDVTMSVNKFGASAPADIVIKNYGFTVENVVKNVKDIL